MNKQHIKYESQIMQWVSKDNVNNNTVHFEWYYESQGETMVWTLYVITHNVRTGQNFLLKHISGQDKVHCYTAMLSYVEHEFRSEHNYIVKWKVNGTPGINTSYFRGKDEKEVQDKFYYDFKGEIVSIQQSPTA